MAPITIVTWNLQGSAGVDIAGVSEILAAIRPDVVAIQEIGWCHARRLARQLGMSKRWVLKHWGWPRPEGLLLLTPHRVVESRWFVLRREPWWDWRRRIALAGVVDRSGQSISVVNVHLSPHDDGPNRRREAAVVLDEAERMPHRPIIAGDFNDVPGGPGPADVAAAGWTDAWTLDRLAAEPGATNWTSGARRGRPPTQRLDYVFAPPGWEIVDAAVVAEPEQLDWFADRSDHLPVSATFRPPALDR